jgi:hypothetical protein
MTRSSHQPSFSSKPFKPREEPVLQLSSISTRSTDQSIHRQLTLDQKKTLGLCFKCGENFFPGYKCKFKGIHLMEGDELDDNDHSTEDDTLLISTNSTAEPTTALITLCAAISSSNHSTLLFQGKIKNLDILAMVDSNNTHSFINPSIVNFLDILLLLNSYLLLLLVGISYLLTKFALS